MQEEFDKQKKKEFSKNFFSAEVFFFGWQKKIPKKFFKEIEPQKDSFKREIQFWVKEAREDVCFFHNE